MTQEEIIAQTISRLRTGEILSASCMYDHGLPSPIVGRSQLQFKDGTFHYRTWSEEPVVPIVEEGVQEKTLDEEGARQCLLQDSLLRRHLGL